MQNEKRVQVNQGKANVIDQAMKKYSQEIWLSNIYVQTIFIWSFSSSKLEIINKLRKLHYRNRDAYTFQSKMIDKANKREYLDAQTILTSGIFPVVIKFEGFATQTQQSAGGDAILSCSDSCRKCPHSYVTTATAINDIYYFGLPIGSSRQSNRPRIYLLRQKSQREVKVAVWLMNRS